MPQEVETLTHIEELIGRLEGDSALRCLEAALARRREELGAEATEQRQDSPSDPVSEVIEYRPHQDGYLQAETRTYYRKDGSSKTHGPYWYFHHQAGGRRKTIYLGKTDEPEAILAARRRNAS